MSAQAALARRVLESLALAIPCLRMMLSSSATGQFAPKIPYCSHSKRFVIASWTNTKTRRRLRVGWTMLSKLVFGGLGAEFIMVDLELAFTFLDIARISKVAESGRRNQRNARMAYTELLRVLPRLLPAFSTP